MTDQMQCRRCRHRFNGDANWLQVLSHYTAPGQRFFYLCEDCREGLLSWIGVAPTADEDLWDHPPPEQPDPDDNF